ncbi:L-threonylcarbamoyladenylate synthase [Abyssibacter profundi]|uniref:Threonylcarbamoyl-AMP synthase n=1 Tax=Abyssibacter profundi TaxID=2182787 RepID=A0A363UND7_9GAMM|nr:L-threonylcarbamoyladenylate synthase [Abyssibacter profundi]MBV60392.1 threonylcarbamoyl-AMP synthase [Nevskiales bacterium]PWN56932.1 threonylcarbamoyl-AMP synthase [Abyssibacter profundi]
MAQHVAIHPVDPQRRLVLQVVDQLHAGAVIAYPTDSSYALGCHIGDKQAMTRIRRLRGFDDKHHMTLMCRDLSEISTYAKVDNQQYRMIRGATPGPYTFVLKATHETPRRLQDAKRKTVGIRIPDNTICQHLLEVLGEPLLTCTALLPGDDLPLSDPDDVLDRLDREVDVIVDGGACSIDPTTIVDLSGDLPEVLREGQGALAALGL